MADPWAAFPDVEETLRELLSPVATVGTFIPVDLKDRLPFIRPYRFAGSDDRITDRAMVGIDVFTGKRDAGVELAERVRQLLIAAPHAVTTSDGVVVVDNVSTAEAPHEVPWGDSAVRRWTATYAVALRRPVGA